MSRKTPREKLAVLLTEALGFHVSPEDLVAATGYWRTSGVECYRWEAFPKNPDGHQVSVSSFDTMTSCSRYGFTLVREMYNVYEAHSKDPS